MEYKILFFTSSIEKGGAEKQILRIYDGMKNKYTCKFFVAKRIRTSKEITSFNKSRTSFAFFSLVKEVKKLHPNIIFTTLPTPNIMNVLIKKYIMKNVKSIVRIANYNLNKKYTKFIITNADIVCFNSVENKNLYSQRFPNDSRKFIYLNNIIKQKNRGVEIANSNKSIKALTVSRLVVQKGIDILINAMERIDNKKIELHIYGEGPELKNLQKLSKNNQIIFKGYSENIAWENYDVFFLPSVKEGLSNSLLEAQFNNVFSIVSDCKAGNKEVIDLTKNGVIFKSKNIEDLAIKIKYYIEGQYKNIHSREKIVNEFSSVKAINTLEDKISTL